MRAMITSYIWNTNFQGSTLSKYIDSISLRVILRHMDVTQYRQELSNAELDSLHIRLRLKLKNDGLGIYSVVDYCDSATLGMWAANVEDIISLLGPHSLTEKDSLLHSKSITHISEVATTMKTRFGDANAFTPAQARDIGLRTGKISTQRWSY